jgi:hypothetical protein
LSSNISFLSSIDSISSIYIISSNNEIEVSIGDIREVGKVLKGNDEYYLYYYDILFDRITINEVEFTDAKLSILYMNDEVMQISIGNIYLRFQEPTSNNLFDFYNAYITVKKIDNYEYISGLVLGLENYTNEEIFIHSISLGSNVLELDINNSIVINEQIEYTADIDNILGFHYDPINTIISANSISLIDKNLYFIPFKYTTEITDLKRFPMFIQYEYQNELNELIIDDFMYASDNFDLNVKASDIDEYIYYYK